MPRALLSVPHRRDVPFAELTTLGLGGLCRWLFEPASEAEAQLFVKTCLSADVGYRVLGCGSNILALSDITAPVMRLALPKKLSITGTEVYATASHGQAALAEEVADMGLSGIEWAVGIPGSFGGALRMNAGAHGGEWGQVLCRVCFLAQDGEITEKPAEDGDFSYRSSFLSDGKVALGAAFKLAKHPPGTIKKTMAGFRSQRRSSQPAGRSAGCVFKNTPLGSAGSLIDRAGLKGTRIGDVEVSAVHANFFVNKGRGSAMDFWELVQLVRAKVLERHGLGLELEIEVWDENHPRRQTPQPQK